jgi:hypothetical protein
MLISDERKSSLKLTFDDPGKLDWVVRDDPQLQEELNQLSDQESELSTKVVNKVLDRIKDL